MKKLNLNISFIRCILCISVLLYHLNILKGGYLAVCSFFVLTGYFASKSLDKSDSLIKYYKKRLKKIYLPLLIIVFASISIISIFKYNLFNIKPEINSILLGYNNYWQLHANADYFAKHINSPFIHLWYIAILLQLELVFPIVYLALKKIGKKVSKFIPLVLFFALTIISTLFFYKKATTGNLMNTYYDTLIRSFSFIYGVFLYNIHSSIKRLIIPIKKISVATILFIAYTILLCLLFIFIGASSKWFALAMILSSFITCRLIEYGTLLFIKNRVIKSHLSNFISNISYEIYLVQYPVIFFFDSIKMNTIYKLLAIISITILISWLIHFALNIHKKDKIIFLRLLVLLGIMTVTLYGIYQYIIMKDYTKEMDVLKKELENNEKIMKQKQEEYAKRQQEEDNKWQEYLDSLEVNEEELKEYVTNLKIVGIGDSILLDAIDTLYKEFPNGYFDGKISRTTCAGVDVLEGIKNKGITWDVIVLSLGTNGYPNDRCKDAMMELAGDSKVFWLNATRADYDTNNAELERYAEGHDNIIILDWQSVIKEHPEYLYSDYIHLRPQGFKPYADFIRDGIYEEYLKEYNAEKDKKIKEMEAKKKDKISFYGNELLINVYDSLQEKYPEAKYEAKNNLKKDELMNLLSNDQNLSKKLVFVFDNQSNISVKDYEKIAYTYQENIIYIVSLKPLNINLENVKIIELKLDEKDYLGDEIHLNNQGNKKLIEQLNKILSE